MLIKIFVFKEHVKNELVLLLIEWRMIVLYCENVFVRCCWIRSAVCCVTWPYSNCNIDNKWSIRSCSFLRAHVLHRYLNSLWTNLSKENQSKLKREKKDFSAHFFVCRIVENVFLLVLFHFEIILFQEFVDEEWNDIWHLPFNIN